MDAKMSRTKIGCCHRAWDTAFTREETAEAVVPDVFPDIASIVDANGVVCLRSKEARQGEVAISAVVNSTVIYQPEGERRVRRLEVNVPFSITVDAPGVDENCGLTARVRLCMIDARALNPRKVLVRAEIAVELEAHCQGELEVASALEEAGGHRVNIRETELSFTVAVAVREKTFVLTDEYSLPASRPPMLEIISRRVELSCEDAKPVGNKLVIKGAALVSILYDSDGEGESAPQSVSFTTEFSQIIDMDVPMDNVAARVSPMLTGAYIEQLGSDGRQISAELHVVAQVVGLENMGMRCIEDAYCNEHPVALTRDSLQLVRLEREISVRETVREVIETTGKVRELIDVSSMPGAVTVQSGKMVCDVRVRVMYRDTEGELRTQSAKFTVTASAGVDEGMFLNSCAAVCPETFATPAAGGIELRMPVDFTAFAMREVQAEPVSALEIDEESAVSAAERPSITVLTATERHTVWSLAKKYCSTPELVLSANGMTSEESISGRLLLIPRAR